jgi:magnesium-transporting ATPase (P-type)
MEVLASDKTGTLTLNQLTLDKEDILAWGDSTKDDVLLMASLSAKWDHNDAIDKAVTGAMGGDIQVRESEVFAFASLKLTILIFVPFWRVGKQRFHAPLRNQQWCAIRSLLRTLPA